MHCLDNVNISKAFDTARLGRPIIQDALREILQFGGELIAFVESALSIVLPNSEAGFDAFCIFVSGVQGDAATRNPN
jgi:hypothetical protein